MKKVVVIGDIILDQYVHGDVSRTSPEAPIPILEQNQVEHRLVQALGPEVVGSWPGDQVQIPP